MNITTSQYRQGRKGCFLSTVRPEPGEKLTLIMPTCRGRRHIPVGNVVAIEPIGTARCLVHVTAFPFVEGMNY